MATSHNAVKMVAHHGIAEHRDAHDPREKLQPLANEFSALVIVFAIFHIFPSHGDWAGSDDESHYQLLSSFAHSSRS